jgi:hypothetical protein
VADKVAGAVVVVTGLVAGVVRGGAVVAVEWVVVVTPELDVTVEDPGIVLEVGAADVVELWAVPPALPCRVAAVVPQADSAAVSASRTTAWRRTAAG